MKRFISICMLLGSCLTMLAQATSLVVDNQTPGWLSSKINYGDQATVRNLKVTGYINATDLKFIGTLIQNRSLDGRLDLSDANVVSETVGGQDNYMDKNPFDIPLPNPAGGDYETYKRLAYFSFPKTLTSFSDFRLRADTVVFDTQIKEITYYLIENCIYRIRWYYFGDNVKIIGGNHGNRYGDIKCFFLPSSLETIKENAFAGRSSAGEKVHEDYSIFNNIKNFSSLKSIGYVSMWVKNKESYPDTLFFPKIETYNINAFKYKKGMHIFLGESLKAIDFLYAVQDKGVVVPLEEVYFHFKSAIPPNSKNFYDSLASSLKKLTIYVPKGSVDAYKSQTMWKYVNVLEDEVPLEKITLNREEVLLDIGETFNLVATPIPENADDATIVWSTDNEGVISLDEGQITALASGIAHVYAKSTDGSIVAMCTVMVKTHAESVAINPAEITLSRLGQTKQLEVIVYPEETFDKSVKWSSSNSSVCTVTQNGMIVAVNYGTAIVLAVTNDGGHIASCVVNVKDGNVPVQSVNLSEHNLFLNKGERYKLRATVLPDNASNKEVLWTVTDEHVVSVDDLGNVTALAAGTTKIVATSKSSGLKDECVVTVLQPVLGVMIDPVSVTLTEVGETKQLTATVLPEDASNQNVTWSSSDTSVCKVSTNGVVTAVAKGFASIVAKTVDGGKQASCIVIVDASTGIADVATDGCVVKNVNGIFLCGTKGDAICVINSQGVVVYRGVCSGSEEQITLPKGLYIVTIGDKTMKIVL